MSLHRRDIAIDVEEFIDGHLRGSDGVFDGEDYIIRNLAVLTDEGEVRGSRRAYLRAVAGHPRHELTGDEGHHAGDAVCGGQNSVPLDIETEVTQ